MLLAMIAEVAARTALAGVAIDQRGLTVSDVAP
jgi:hypothetical protein